MTESTPLLCPLPRHDRPAELHPPARICATHTRRLRHTITDIHRLWRLLPALADTVTGHGRRSGVDTAAPCRLDIVAITDPHSLPDPDTPPAAAILLAWAQLVTDTRHWRPATTPLAAIDVITRSVDWLTCHPAVGDLWPELAAIHRTLRHVAGETQAAIGTCQQPHPDPQRDGECGGPLVHRPGGDVIVVCLDCGDSWTRGAIDLAWQQWTDQERQHA